MCTDYAYFFSDGAFDQKVERHCPRVQSNKCPLLRGQFLQLLWHHQDQSQTTGAGIVARKW